jgi:transposase-like protein
MIPKEFSEYFTACDQPQQQEIINDLLLLAMQNESLPEHVDVGILKCPHCRSKDVRGNGKLKEMQRYVCKDCNKNFSQSTGKFWYALKKRNLIIKYLYCLISGYSIRKSAGLTGVSIQTSFDWRHKLLTSFKTVMPDDFRGIVEQYDLYFQYSEKGKRRAGSAVNNRTAAIRDTDLNGNQVAVLATCDRSGIEDLRVITNDKISTADILNTLNGRVRKADVLVSYSLQCTSAIGDEIKLELRTTETYKRKKKSEAPYHIRNVNNMSGRLINFMSPFHGVATKYLQNYMNWFIMLEKIRDTTKKIATVAQVALSSDLAWYDFKNKNINIYFRT